MNWLLILLLFCASLLILDIIGAALTNHHHKHSHKGKGHIHYTSNGKPVRQRNAALLHIVGGGGGYSLNPSMANQPPFVDGYSNTDDFFIRTGLKPAGPSSYAYQQPDGSYVMSLPSSSTTATTNFNSYSPSMQFSENGLTGSSLPPIVCETQAQSNCVDRRSDCVETAQQGECDKRPGLMLRHCRRSCCNCDDSKCYDSTDEPKLYTLCYAQNRQSNSVVLSACDIAETRQNALDYCPKTCGTCQNVHDLSSLYDK